MGDRMKLLKTQEEFISLEIGTLCYIECDNERFNKNYFIIIEKIEKNYGNCNSSYYFIKNNKILRMNNSFNSYTNSKIWVIE